MSGRWADTLLRQPAPTMSDRWALMALPWMEPVLLLRFSIQEFSWPMTLLRMLKAANRELWLVRTSPVKAALTIHSATAHMWQQLHLETALFLKASTLESHRRRNSSIFAFSILRASVTYRQY